MNISNEKNNGAVYPANPQSKPSGRPDSERINEGKTVGRPTPQKK